MLNCPRCGAQMVEQKKAAATTIFFGMLDVPGLEWDAVTTQTLIKIVFAT